jgi:hypothetical protein
LRDDAPVRAGVSTPLGGPRIQGRDLVLGRHPSRRYSTTAASNMLVRGLAEVGTSRQH